MMKILTQPNIIFFQDKTKMSVEDETFTSTGIDDVVKEENM